MGNKGKVYLIGAGPGDPKLITVKGLEALRKGDVVVYDRLASPSLLAELKPGAEKIYVGKLPDRHTMKQEEINRLLVDLALRGKTVIRLKGGDPGIFGRVGEEAGLLAEHGIEYEIVPGVSSVTAVPAYAGIPVTHRDFASSVTIVTGHENPDKLDQTIRWDHLAACTDTLIFLMGVGRIRHIAAQLMQHGKSPDTAVALIRWGTTTAQETLTGTLSTIAGLVEQSGFQSPAVIVIGSVVELRKKLAWFEHKPLFGQRVLVTRARSQSSELAALIEEWGGEACEFPVIVTRLPADPQKLRMLDESLKRVDSFEWIVFTSANGVEFFLQRLMALQLDIRLLSKAKIAAVGPKTAEALQRFALKADLTAEKFVAEGLLQALIPQLQAGQRILLPRADIASPLLPEELKQRGFDVTEADAYETVISEDNDEAVIERIQRHEIQVITFTSSSTVNHFISICSKHGISKADIQQALIACIGPKTAETAARHGLHVDVTAEEATIRSLLEAIAAKTGSGRKNKEESL